MEIKERVNNELNRIGIPLNHEHASYFRDGFKFAYSLLTKENEELKQELDQSREILKDWLKIGNDVLYDNGWRASELTNIIEKTKQLLNNN